GMRLDCGRFRCYSAAAKKKTRTCARMRSGPNETAPVRGASARGNAEGGSQVGTNVSRESDTAIACIGASANDTRHDARADREARCGTLRARGKHVNRRSNDDATETALVVVRAVVPARAHRGGGSRRRG